ncbi:MAG TPA: hybrid sensor histidine kinase/response regulator [Coleofasciculaceae cyanobacterium]|jgi:two-component system sensor histidine kinase/response regulator
MNAENTDTGTILLVDDNPTNLGVLFESLSDCGFKLLVAQDGESAIAQLGYALPDIILLDVMMPGIDGFETCRRLKASKRTKDIPIIFMTALAETVDKVKGFSVGAIDYVTKPIQPEEVLARVRCHLAVQNLQKQLQEKNQQLQQEIRDRQKAEVTLRVFLHAVSHDLRNPVTGMLMVLKNLLNRENQPENRQLNTLSQESQRQPPLAINQVSAHSPDIVPVSRSVLERMATSCDRQLSLINSLLEVQEGELCGVCVQCLPLNLHTLIQSLAADWEPMLLKNQATLNNTISDELPLVSADFNQLWRVFENLIANALKHNPPGVIVTLSAEVIAVSTQESGTVEMLRCTVADDGVGMTTKQCSRLFELYTRGTNTRHTTGLGLGLYLCRQIIMAHGGQIEVISSPGTGSKFWFTLPLASNLHI